MSASGPSGPLVSYGMGLEPSSVSVCFHTFKHEYLETSWICGVRDDDEVSADTLCAMLGVQEMTAALRTRRLRWFGHVARSSSCINSITSMTIHSARKRGRP